LNQIPQNTKTTILFDGFCHLCSRSVRFISKRDKLKVFTFISLQSEEAESIAGIPSFNAALPETIILLEHGKVYDKSTAALRISRHLSFPWNMLYVFILVPHIIRDSIYMFVSRNRYRWFGKRESCYLK